MTRKEISRINSNNNINITQGELSISQNNIFPSSSLSEVELFNTYQTWKKLSYFYANQYYKIFNKEKKINEVQNKLKLAIKTEIDKYKYMSYYLYINSLETLSKIFCASKLVFKLMDNWIIDSMMYQNDAMSKLFNKLKSISVEDILQDRGVLDKENIYSNIELDDFSEKYKLFNYNEFLFDGQTDKNKFLTPKELNSKEFDVNIEKIMRLFTNWGCTNTNFDDIYGEMITVIKNGEIQNGIITKNTF